MTASLAGFVEAVGPVRAALLGWYTVLSATAFIMYGTDKRAAEMDARRISESALHLVSLAGGWPGALAGQKTFRHKTKKQPFRRIFWVTVAANSAVLVLLLAAQS